MPSTVLFTPMNRWFWLILLSIMQCMNPAALPTLLALLFDLYRLIFSKVITSCQHYLLANVISQRSVWFTCTAFVFLLFAWIVVAPHFAEDNEDFARRLSSLNNSFTMMAESDSVQWMTCWFRLPLWMRGIEQGKRADQSAWEVKLLEDENKRLRKTREENYEKISTLESELAEIKKTQPAAHHVATLETKVENLTDSLKKAEDDHLEYIRNDEAARSKFADEIQQHYRDIERHRAAKDLFWKERKEHETTHKCCVSTNTQVINNVTLEQQDDGALASRDKEITILRSKARKSMKRFEEAEKKWDEEKQKIEEAAADAATKFEHLLREAEAALSQLKEDNSQTSARAEDAKNALNVETKKYEEKLIAELASANQTHLEILNALRAEKQAVESKIIAFDHEIKRSKEESQKLRSENAELTASITRLQVEITATNKSFASERNQLQQQIVQGVSSSQEYNQMRLERDSAQQQVTELSNHKTFAEQQLAKEKREALEQLSKVSNEKDQIVRDFESQNFPAQIIAKDAEIQRLNGFVTDLQSSKNDDGEKSAEIAALKDEAVKLEKRASDAEKLQVAQLGQNTTLCTQLAAVQEELNQVKAHDKSAEIAALKDEVVKLEKRASDAEKLHVAQLSKNTTLSVQLIVSEEELKQARAQKELVQHQSAEANLRLITSNNELSKHVEILNKEKTDLQASLQALIVQQSVNQLETSRVKKLQEDNTESSFKIKMLRDDVARLQRKIDAYDKQIKTHVCQSKVDMGAFDGSLGSKIAELQQQNQGLQTAMGNHESSMKGVLAKNKMLSQEKKAALDEKQRVLDDNSKKDALIYQLKTVGPGHFSKETVEMMMSDQSAEIAKLKEKIKAMEDEKKEKDVPMTDDTNPNGTSSTSSQPPPPSSPRSAPSKPYEEMLRDLPPQPDSGKKPKRPGTRAMLPKVNKPAPPPSENKRGRDVEDDEEEHKRTRASEKDDISSGKPIPQPTGQPKPKPAEKVKDSDLTELASFYEQSLLNLYNLQAAFDYYHDLPRITHVDGRPLVPLNLATRNLDYLGVILKKIGERYEAITKELATRKYAWSKVGYGLLVSTKQEYMAHERLMKEIVFARDMSKYYSHFSPEWENTAGNLEDQHSWK